MTLLQPLGELPGEAILEVSETGGTFSGAASIAVELQPHPSRGFMLEADGEGTAWGQSAKTVIGSGIPLEAAKLAVGGLFGQIDVHVSRVQGATASGFIESPRLPSDRITSAKLLVINGPDVSGERVMRGGAVACDRLSAKIGGGTVTMDRLRTKDTQRRPAFDFTHVAEIRFEEPQPATDVQSLQLALFRALSLIKGRWVGLLGPSLYSSASLVRVSVGLTKTSRRGRGFSWCPARPESSDG